MPEYQSKIDESLKTAKEFVDIEEVFTEIREGKFVDDVNDIRSWTKVLATTDDKEVKDKNKKTGKTSKVDFDS